MRHVKQPSFISTTTQRPFQPQKRAFDIFPFFQKCCPYCHDISYFFSGPKIYLTTFKVKSVRKLERQM